MNYKDIVGTIREIKPNNKIIISFVIQRYDKNSLQPKTEELNSKLKSFCAKHKMPFIDHSNIMDIHIGTRGLHLNHSGKARLALNLKECMNSLLSGLDADLLPNTGRTTHTNTRLFGKKKGLLICSVKAPSLLKQG